MAMAMTSASAWAILDGRPALFGTDDDLTT